MVQHHVNVFDRAILTLLCLHMHHMGGNLLEDSAVKTDQGHWDGTILPSVMQRFDSVGRIAARRYCYDDIARAHEVPQLPCEDILVTNIIGQTGKKGGVGGKAQCSKRRPTRGRRAKAQIVGKVACRGRAATVAEQEYRPPSCPGLEEKFDQASDSFTIKPAKCAGQMLHVESGVFGWGIGSRKKRRETCHRRASLFRFSPAGLCLVATRPSRVLHLADSWRSSTVGCTVKKSMEHCKARPEKRQEPTDKKMPPEPFCDTFLLHGPPGLVEKTGMRKLNPEYAEQISTLTNQCPYFKLLSMHVKELGVGRSLLEIDLAQKHLQPFGVVHGGVFSSILDAAAFWAVYTTLDESLGMTTVDLKVNYLAPASDGKLIARGTCIKSGKTLGLAEATVSAQDGRILAHGTSTLIVIPDFDIEWPGERPKKFIEG